VLDNNDAHLSFLGLGGRVQVIYVTPGGPLPLMAPAVEHVAVVGAAAAPVGWACPYRGRQLAVCVRPDGAN
jgi:hypothetical protein